MNAKIAVVIPCYKVRSHILSVLNNIGNEVERIIVVDDKCPEETGLLVQEKSKDPRVSVLFNVDNLGVGGATIRGLKKAINESYDIIVKLDGDGQMDPSFISFLVNPILRGQADSTKGNRFYKPEYLKSMPRLRLVGNSALSFVSKLSSGYWSLMDPTNGFLAIHNVVAKEIEWDKVSPGYFFESDLLCHLALSKAVVRNVPMPANYGSENSNLSIPKALFEFSFMHINRLVKRIFFNYLLRDFNAASLMLLNTLLFLPFGVIFGGWTWYTSYKIGKITPTGTIMLAILPIVLGYQSVLSFLQYDIQNEPAVPRQHDS